MRNLLKAEFYKLQKAFVYRMVLLTYFLYMFNQTFKEAASGIEYTGAEWFSKMHMHVPYVHCFIILSAFIVAGEFTDRTFLSGFLCGFSRGKVFLAKTTIYFMAILPVMLIHILTGMMIRTFLFGFGMNLNIDTVSYIVKMTGYCIIGFTGFGGFTFLCAMLGRSRVAAIGLSYGALQAIGVFAGNLEYFKNETIKKPLQFIFSFTAFYQLGELNGGHSDFQIPFVLSIISSWVIFGCMIGISAYAFIKRDLK